MNLTLRYSWRTVWVCADYESLPVDVINAVLRAELRPGRVEA